MNNDILYTIFIYRDEKKLEIFDKENNLISEFNYENDRQMYNHISLNTKDCKDIDKIRIIQK